MPENVFGLFRKHGPFGYEELIQLYENETFAFSQKHSRQLSNPFYTYFIKELTIDETKNQAVLCPKRKDGLI